MAAAAVLIIAVMIWLSSSAAAQPAAQPGGMQPAAGGLDSLGAVLGGIFGGSGMNQSTLDAMSWAVTNQEGQPGDRNYRNNNPGDLKPPDGSSNYWQGQVGVDDGGFAIFDTWQDGWRALQLDLANHVADNPNQTISQFFAVYSPDSTGLSGVYGANIAAALGVSPEATLGSLT